jgi:hypothetical protein
MSTGIAVRVEHTRKLIMTGWNKTGRGEYRHDTGRGVKRDCNTGTWECTGGGSHDGERYMTMNVAMYYATR